MYRKREKEHKMIRAPGIFCCCCCCLLNTLTNIIYDDQE